MSRKQIENLDREIIEIQRSRGEWYQGPGEAQLNIAESAFVRALARKKPGAKTLRHGWPDFIVLEPGKNAYAIEVKRREDRVREGQKATFAFLESIGIKVFVWCPDHPDTLTPWKLWKINQKRYWHGTAPKRGQGWRRGLRGKVVADQQ